MPGRAVETLALEVFLAVRAKTRCDKLAAGMAALATITWAINANAQNVVVNPTKVEFRSSDHNATLSTGQPAISRYVLQFFLVGVDPRTGQPVQENDIGKPAPVAGTVDLISVDRSQTFLALPVGQEFIATVKAVGPAGDSQSAASNAFTHLLGPNPPELVRVGPSANEIVLHASDVLPDDIHGRWQAVSTPGAAGSLRLENVNQNEAKVATALASPVNYVEVTFNAAHGVPYRMWLRMRAASDHYGNDSLHVQFSGSVNSSSQPVFRIGSTTSAAVVLEEGSGANVQGWGWNDHSYGALAEPVYFETSGPQTIRIQQREDGISFDQIVLSAWTYHTRSPGAFKNDTVIVPKPQ